MSRRMTIKKTHTEARTNYYNLYIAKRLVASFVAEKDAIDIREGFNDQQMNLQIRKARK